MPPVITGISGSTAHGGLLTITGTGFGTKPTAAPVLWDDSSSVAADIRDLWEDGWPQGCVNPAFDIQRRTAPFRTVSPPHNRVGRFITGAHGEGANPFDATKGPNVVCWKNFAGNPTVSPIPLYVSYWQRYDPNWQFAASGNNIKPCIYGMNSPPTLGSRIWFSYMAHLPLDYTDFTKWQLASEQSFTPSYLFNGHVEGVNPYSNWIKIEFVCNMANDATGFLRVYENGKGPMIARNNQATDSNNVNNRRMGIGGFGRPYDGALGAENYRYFTDCYIDNSLSRVILGNNDTLNSQCTIREIQVAGAWSDPEITIPSVNRGVIGDADGMFAFVVDSNNVASPGFEIGSAPPPPPPPPPNVRGRIVSTRVPGIAGVRF